MTTTDWVASPSRSQKIMKPLITLSVIAVFVGCVSSRVVQPNIDFAEVERIVIHRSMDQWVIEDEERIHEIIAILKPYLRNLTPSRYTYPSPEWTIILEASEVSTSVFHRDGWIGTRDGTVAMPSGEQIKLLRLIERPVANQAR